MLNYYILTLLCFLFPLYGREGSTDTLITEKAKELHGKIHKDCHRGYFFDFITSEWLPTMLFGTALTYQGVKSYKSEIIPRLFPFKNDYLTSNKFMLASGTLLLGCMLYKYYKPMVERLYYRYKYGKKTAS